VFPRHVSWLCGEGYWLSAPAQVLRCTHTDHLKRCAELLRPMRPSYQLRHIFVRASKGCGACSMATHPPLPRSSDRSKERLVRIIYTVRNIRAASQNRGDALLNPNPLSLRHVPCRGFVAHRTGPDTASGQCAASHQKSPRRRLFLLLCNCELQHCRRRVDSL